MAKMFYSLEEAAQKLGKSEDDVRQMAAKNEITEFRDGDRLIFKVDQIDALTGGEEQGGSDDTAGGASGMIPLADSAEASALGLADSSLKSGSGGGIDLGDLDADESSPPSSDDGDDEGSADASDAAGGSGFASGISVFDADELEEADPSAVTQVTEEKIDDVSLESFGSGSGLMDLTRESDDTSLGADGLLDDLYTGDEGGEQETATEGALFEGASAGGGLADEGAGPALAPQVETVDGPGSGLVGGLSLGMLLAAALGVAVVLMAVSGMGPAPILDLVQGNVLILLGGLAGVLLLTTGVGFVLGKKAG